MTEVATGPVASVAVNNWFHIDMMESSAWMPTSVAHVTNHRTISRRRQFMLVFVSLITCNPSWKATLRRAG